MNYQEQPRLVDWEPQPEEQFFSYDKVQGSVFANYEGLFGLEPGTRFSYFDIIKPHYKERMPDIVKHLNYYLTFYDVEHELFVALMSLKSIIDQKDTLSTKSFQRLMMKRVITDKFVQLTKEMANFLFVYNIDTDDGIKYSSTPKITNPQAKQLTTLSFAYRFITPLCVHYSNHNVNFPKSKSYIDIFDRLYMKILKKFEKNDTKFFLSVVRFIQYRCDRQYNSNRGTWAQKKQLYGSTKELYLEEIVHEVLMVKSLHKYDYTKSIVSFIDGLVRKYNLNFRRENYKTKPFEIDNDDSEDDNDYQTHAEQIEMSNYRVDESNMLINDANHDYVMEALKKKYPFKIPDEEFAFYKENLKMNEANSFLITNFYSKMFSDGYAMNLIPEESTILLVLYMKKWMQLKGLDILAQILSAKMQGKYRDNLIKNAKFIEKVTSSDIWTHIIVPKYRYVAELDGNYNSILKQFSAFINSTFVIVDFNPEINGIECENADVDKLADETLRYLSII